MLNDAFPHKQYLLIGKAIRQKLSQNDVMQPRIDHFLFFVFVFNLSSGGETKWKQIFKKDYEASVVLCKAFSL